MKLKNIIEEYLIEYIQYEKGHENHEGENAPWTIRSHDTRKIIASFKTKKEAEKHLKRMKTYSNKE